MYRELELVSPQELLQIYYLAVTKEVGGKVIKSMFVGGISQSTTSQIKKDVRAIMAEKQIRSIRPGRVNIDCLFEYLGIDTENLEKLRKKLIRLQN